MLVNYSSTVPYGCSRFDTIKPNALVMTRFLFRKSMHHLSTMLAPYGGSSGDMINAAAIQRAPADKKRKYGSRVDFLTSSPTSSVGCCIEFSVGSTIELCFQAQFSNLFGNLSLSFHTQV